MDEQSTATEYKGYVAYGYLDEGVDYPHTRWAKQVGRVAPYMGDPLSSEERQRAERLLRENIVISLHDHPQVYPEDMSLLRSVIRSGRQPMGYEGLARSGITAVFDNGMDGFCCISSEAGWKYDDVLFDLGVRMADISHQDFVIKAERVDDIRRAHAEGKVAEVFSLESAAMIGNEVDRIDVLYGFGVRQMGIAYSEANFLGSGLSERGDGGLTYFGERAVRRMNQVGMAIDISHSGDVTALDVVRASTKPVLITHCGSREIWPIARMKPDALIKECCERGGVIGIEAAPHTTLSRDHPRHSLDSVMDHFEHLVDVVGIDHVAFGPDSLFGDHVALHEEFAANMSIGSATDGPQFEHVPYVDGLENPGECFHNIVAWLVSHGYSDSDICAVVGGNVLRALEEIWC